MTEEKKRDILKSYLGRYYVPFNIELRDSLIKGVPESAKSILCIGPASLFEEVAQFFMLRRKKHVIFRVVTVKELTDIQMSNNRDAESLYDLRDSLIVVKWFAKHMSSKLDQELVSTFIDFRINLVGRDTIVYTDRTDYEDTIDFFDKVINLRGSTISSKRKITGSSTGAISSADSEI